MSGDRGAKDGKRAVLRVGDRTGAEQDQLVGGGGGAKDGTRAPTKIWRTEELLPFSVPLPPTVCMAIMKGPFAQNMMASISTLSAWHLGSPHFLPARAYYLSHPCHSPSA